MVVAIWWLVSGVVIGQQLSPPRVSASTEAVSVSWQGRGDLYRSENLLNGWAFVEGAESPFLENREVGGECFYRVIYQTSQYIPVDTNQLVSYDDSGNEMEPAPAVGQSFFGQDGQYVQHVPTYTDHGDGTVTDFHTGLTWQKTPPEAFYSRAEAEAYADALELGGESDWRLPTIKELLSLADFSGSSRAEIDLPYIDTAYFDVYDPLLVSTFVPASAAGTKRDIDGQFWSSTDYVGRTINNDSSTFGYNFIDGRIKAYPNGLLSGPTGTAFVRCVRGSTEYGKNNFIDNGDGTITDLSTGLMWLQNDSGSYPDAGSQGDGTLDWGEALDWAESLEFSGYDDWRLPDAKQLHTIVDYTRAPDAADEGKQSVAIDPMFHTTSAEPWFWSSTSLGDDLFAWGVYIAFGRALAIDPTLLTPTVNAHGAGAMRSDPKAGDPAVYAGGHGPQLDQVRIYNYARPVRQAFIPSPPREPANVSVVLSEEAPADLAELPSQVNFNGVAVDLTSLTRPNRQTLEFNHVIYGLAPGDYVVEAWFSNGVFRGTYTIEPNILLMIVDDWGVDASARDNATPGGLFAKMPHMNQLADEGIRFTRAYAQPTCSPTRATILTGRQPWQHGVGSPSEAGNFSEDELTLPDIFSMTSAPHAMLSVGKWHLGGNDTGPMTRGGWPEFYGITGGAVPNYSNWSKNSNGVAANSTTYTTTDQVNETVKFIETNEVAGTPWFAWVAFNGVHDPFHDPPEALAPTGGYSSIGTGESTVSHQYRKMLEALDTEMGRLLRSVDPARTHVIVIGDNGTPGEVVQAPYGDGHAKGSIYNGGTHVPMVIKGPSVNVPSGGTSDTLVHCVDLFSTILEMAGIEEAAVTGLSGRNVVSTSIVPVLEGMDGEDRWMIAESREDLIKRSIILDDYPSYKLVITNDPTTLLDPVGYEFYDLSGDVNEQSPLAIDSLSGVALAAYQACRAKSLAYGGDYDEEAVSGFDTLYIELPTSGVSPSVPSLTRPNGNEIAVSSVAVDGHSAVVVGRFDSGSNLADEADDGSARYWVKVRMSPANGGPYTSAHVIFPDQSANQGGAAREYDSVNTILVNEVP